MRLLTEYEYFETEQGGEEDAARIWRSQIEYAYFAANLGWGYEQYGSCTPVQLLFIRKEIEKKTVRESNLIKDAVQVAVARCFGKRDAVLWRRLARKDGESPIPISEIEELQKRFAENAPWTPWAKGGASVG